MKISQYATPENNNTCIDAYSNIRKGAGLDRTYVIMNILATVIACYGLLANSPAVVIGAMVVAMLLGPLIGIALGVVEADNATLRKSIVTEVIGIIIVYVTALTIGYIHRDSQITNEILSRTAPNFIDLMIAIAGGAAGAYALISPRIGLSLVGVAVAIALVPPLSSSAILLARGDFSMAGNAALLAFTNMIAIEFIATIMLLIFKCGKASFNLNLKSLVKALPRFSISIIIFLALGVVLFGNLRQVITDQTFRTQTYGIVQEQITELSGMYLEEVRYETTPQALIVRAVVRGPFELTPAQVAYIAGKLPAPPNGLTMDFRLRFVKTIVITGNGYLYDDSASLIK
jgi:uncharacterized hydrophobic protein (TIGR00271 family)